MSTREELAEQMRYHQRAAETARRRADVLAAALAFGRPILERVAAGGTWSMDGQGGDAAREALRMARRALS